MVDNPFTAIFRTAFLASGDAYRTTAAAVRAIPNGDLGKSFFHIVFSSFDYIKASVSVFLVFYTFS
jgi:hypothetical protein